MNSARVHSPRRRARTSCLAAAGGLLAAAVLPVAGAAPAAAHSPAAYNPASAAAPARPAPRQPLTFGVQPSGPNKPDRRSYFSYGATPGASIRDHLAVVNLSHSALTLRVYARDAFNTSDGGFDLLPATAKSVDVGSWVKVQSSVVKVKARSRVIMPFSLAVPRNGTPGDHAGGVVAALTTTRIDGHGNPVRIEERVGARIYLRVAGPLHPKLTVSGMQTSYHGTPNPAGCASLAVSYQVRNEGNVRLTGHQRVRVSGPLGIGAKTQDGKDLPDLLPGNTMTVDTTVQCVRPTLRVNATATVNPVPLPGDTSPGVPSVIARSGLWALPWIGLGMLLVLLVLGGLYLRKRRRERQPTGGGPTPPRETASVAAAPADEDG